MSRDSSGVKLCSQRVRGSLVGGELSSKPGEAGLPLGREGQARAEKQGKRVPEVSGPEEQALEGGSKIDRAKASWFSKPKPQTLGTQQSFFFFVGASEEFC